jgi:hypothetical protein
MNYPPPHSAGPAERTLSCWHETEGWVSWERWKVLQVHTPAPPRGWTLREYLMEHPHK